MSRTQAITGAQFGGAALGQVLAARVVRRAELHPSAGDAARSVCSVQPGPTAAEVELTTRDVRTAESLAIGATGALVLVQGPTQAGQLPRRVTLPRVVLHAVELRYEQAAPAAAVLRFLAEAPDPAAEPFAAEDVEEVQP